LRSFHPEAAQEVAIFEAGWVKKRDDDDKKLEELYNHVETRTHNEKRDQPDDSDSTSDNSDTPRTPGKINFNLLYLIYKLNFKFDILLLNLGAVHTNKRTSRRKFFQKTPKGTRPSFVTTMPAYFQRVVKHGVRSPVQLKFDLAIMKYLASCNLSFNHVNQPGFQEFVKYLDPKMHVKSARTFARSKLPLLFKLVKEAVTIKIQTDLKKNLGGLAFSTDMWSSK